MSVGFSGRVLLKEGSFRAAGSSSSEVITDPINWSNSNITEHKILPSSFNDNGYFGVDSSISSDGNTVIIGSNGYNNARGRAFIYTRSGSVWSEQAILEAVDGVANDFFGASVSISADGNTVVVGAPYNNTPKGEDAGAAYIFTRSGSTWNQQAKIEASDGITFDYFGSSVSISSDGNYIIVGSFGDDDTASMSGSAYIFVRSGSTWTQQAKIKANDPAGGDRFGLTVDISSDGTYAIVSSAYNDDAGSESGSAYVFIRNNTTWALMTKLTASDAAAGDYFGRSVSISADGTTAVIGAWQDDDVVSGSGSAYIFTRSGTSWSQEAKITTSDPNVNDYFGLKVAISGDGNTVIVSSEYDDDNGNESGSAYIFTRSGTTWTQVRKIIASDGAAGDSFGYSVSITGDGNRVVIGARSNDELSSEAGAAYIYEIA